MKIRTFINIGGSSQSKCKTDNAGDRRISQGLWEKMVQAVGISLYESMILEVGMAGREEKR